MLSPTLYIKWVMLERTPKNLGKIRREGDFDDLRQGNHEHPNDNDYSDRKFLLQGHGDEVARRPKRMGSIRDMILTKGNT